MKNKKGLINEIYMVIILFIVLIVLIGGFWFVASVGPLVVGEGKELTGILRTNIRGNPSNDSFSNATTNAVNVSTDLADSFLGLIESIVYFAFLGFLIGYIAICFYVRTFKWLAFVWIGLIIALVVLSMFISNAYEQAYNSSTNLAELYSTWGTNHFILTNLPYIVGIFGVLSGIVLFVIITTDNEEESRFIQ